MMDSITALQWLEQVLLISNMQGFTRKKSREGARWYYKERYVSIMERMGVSNSTQRWMKRIKKCYISQ